MNVIKEENQRQGVKYQYGESTFEDGDSNSVRIFYESSNGGFNPKSPEMEFEEFYRLAQWCIEENLFSDTQKLELIKKLVK